MSVQWQLSGPKIWERRICCIREEIDLETTQLWAHSYLLRPWKDTINRNVTTVLIIGYMPGLPQIPVIDISMAAITNRRDRANDVLRTVARPVAARTFLSRADQPDQSDERK